MRASKLPKGAEIAGSDFAIIDDGNTTKRVSFSGISEFFKDEFSGGGGGVNTH